MKCFDFPTWIHQICSLFTCIWSLFTCTTDVLHETTLAPSCFCSLLFFPPLSLSWFFVFLLAYLCPRKWVHSCCSWLTEWCFIFHLVTLVCINCNDCPAPSWYRRFIAVLLGHSARWSFNWTVFKIENICNNRWKSHFSAGAWTRGQNRTFDPLCDNGCTIIKLVLWLLSSVADYEQVCWHLVSMRWTAL